MSYLLRTEGLTLIVEKFATKKIRMTTSISSEARRNQTTILIRGRENHISLNLTDRQTDIRTDGHKYLQSSFTTNKSNIHEYIVFIYQTRVSQFYKLYLYFMALIFVLSGLFMICQHLKPGLLVCLQYFLRKQQSYCICGTLPSCVLGPQIHLPPPPIIVDFRFSLILIYPT